MNLTRRQKQAYSFIKDYMNDHGVGQSCGDNSIRLGWKPYTAMNRAYNLHRVIVNRKFDAYYPAEPLCKFFPGGDNHYYVQRAQHRQPAGT